MKIKDKLQELKNEYPELNLKALVIKNNDLNFAFTFRNYFGVSTIESNDYQGILYQIRSSVLFQYLYNRLLYMPW